MKRDHERATIPVTRPMTHQDVTDLIVMRKMRKKLRWTDVAKAMGQSKEWCTAACMGQMQMTEAQAAIIGDLFDLPEEAVELLQTVSYKGSLPTVVPTDPLIYRFH